MEPTQRWKWTKNLLPLSRRVEENLEDELLLVVFMCRWPPFGCALTLGAGGGSLMCSCGECSFRQTEQS